MVVAVVVCNYTHAGRLLREGGYGVPAAAKVLSPSLTVGGRQSVLS